MATKKMYFRTPVDEPKVIETPTGEKLEDEIAMKLDEKGNEIFYIKGKTNVYEKTQAYADETNIENILARCVATGDMSILERAKGQYMDMTEMPENFIEANNRIKEAEDTFNKLPLEIRKKYEFNFNKYLADFGTDNWIQNMGLDKNNLEEVKEEIKEEKGE